MIVRPRPRAPPVTMMVRLEREKRDWTGTLDRGAERQRLSEFAAPRAVYELQTWTSNGATCKQQQWCTKVTGSQAKNTPSHRQWATSFHWRTRHAKARRPSK